jgi:hypothetical protein
LQKKVGAQLITDSGLFPFFTSICPKCRGTAALEAVDDRRYDFVCLNCGERMQPLETLSVIKKKPVVQLKELESFLRQKLEAHFKVLRKGLARAGSTQ